MRIVTAGSKYLDIDAYAGCVAYAELLQRQGIEAKAVSTAPLNESICQTVRSWGVPIGPSDITQGDTFTLIDLSDPEHCDSFVDVSKVDEVIDHHAGFEEYWKERLAENARIEFIGAACTLVYERWVAAEMLDHISTLSARLLVCGILDNTLNFGAKITTQRDIDAYDVLLARAELPDNWTEQYFTECQEAILHDVAAAVANDVKTISFRSHEEQVAFGQFVVWDGGDVLSKHGPALRDALKSTQPHWFMNLISVGERKSYFYTDNTDVQAWLSKLLGVNFDGSLAIADRLWLRKEVIKQDMVL